MATDEQKVTESTEPTVPEQEQKPAGKPKRSSAATERAKREAAAPKPKQKVKPIYVKVDEPSKAEKERAAAKAVSKKAGSKKVATKTTKKKPAGKKRESNQAVQHFDKLIRDHVKESIQVYEMIKKSTPAKPITRNGHLTKDGDLLKSRIAYRLFDAGLVNMTTVDAEGQKADSKAAFRNKTMDRLYTPMKPVNADVEKLLYGLRKN